MSYRLVTPKNYRKRGRRDKSKKNSWTGTIVLVVAIGVFIFSGFQLFSIFSEYSAGKGEYDDLQELVVTEQNAFQGKEEEKDEAPAFVVDFEKLKAINSDVIGWIRFDNPSEINYPVVLSSDNADYLHTTFEGKYNAAGTLFVDYQNRGNFSDDNTFIYGHNMKNGSMFGRLRKYRDSSYRDENPYFYIYTPDGKVSTYEIFAACVVTDTSQTFDKLYASSEEYAEYIRYVRRCSLYSTNTEVTVDSKMVSLSTCTNVRDEERLVIHGVKIDEKMAGE